MKIKKQIKLNNKLLKEHPLKKEEENLPIKLQIKNNKISNKRQLKAKDKRVKQEKQDQQLATRKNLNHIITKTKMVKIQQAVIKVKKK
jgi:hypothetical protein